LNIDVGALTRKNERKGRKHESQSGSAGPLYFRGYLDEIRSVGSIRDSFWGLKELQRVVEPQYIAEEALIMAPRTIPHAISPVSVTSAPVSAE
jgi:hypothetical protein